MESESDSEDDFKTPLKNLNEMLRKVTVYRSMKKHRKAKNIVQEINSQESNISSVATLSGSKYSNIRTCISWWKLRKSTKVIKSTSEDFRMNKKSRPQIYTSMKRCCTACQIGNTVNYILCLVPSKRHIKIIIWSKVGLSINLAWLRLQVKNHPLWKRYGKRPFEAVNANTVKIWAYFAKAWLALGSKVFPRTILAQSKQHGVSFGVIPKYLMIMTAAMISMKAWLQTSFPLKNAFWGNVTHVESITTEKRLRISTRIF